jgi:hypothetical protein
MKENLKGLENGHKKGTVEVYLLLEFWSYSAETYTIWFTIKIYIVST